MPCLLGWAHGASIVEEAMPRRTSHRGPHPAPDPLRLVQEFLNTRRIETHTEELASPRALADWLSHQQLLWPDAVVDETLWQQGLAAREALRALARHHSGRRLTAEEVKVFQELFDEASPDLRLSATGKLGLVASGNGWPRVLSHLLLIVFEAVRVDTWRRFKICRNEGCQLAFYDSSTNQSGKWCNAKACGNRFNAGNTRRRRAWRDRQGAGR